MGSSRTEPARSRVLPGPRCAWLVALTALLVAAPFAVFWRGTVQSSGFVAAMTFAMYVEQHFGVLYPEIAAASAEYRGFYTVLRNSRPASDAFHLGAFRYLTDGPVFGLSNMYGHVPGATTDNLVIAGRPNLLITPDNYGGERSLIYLHGGAFVAGSATSHESFVRDLAIMLNATALVVDYRLLPENSIHDSINDTLAAYSWLAERFPPEKMVLLGESAGAALSLLTIAALKRQNMPLPAGAGLMSQGCCYEYVMGEEQYNELPSVKYFNHSKDPIVRSLVQVDKLMDIIEEPSCQLADTCRDLLGDLTGFPPLFIAAGANEYLADVSASLARDAKAAGVDARLELTPLMPHVFQMFHRLLPEAQSTNAEMIAFLERAMSSRA